MDSQRLTALVVPHTHWDRAWYWPAARMQVKLIECLDTVLELLERHPEYRFTCDGQALMVADYLDARPEQRPLIERFAREGRLKIGPLYTQPDLYCTGGESLIRNLLHGTAYAAALGARQRTLYLPDTFGIVPSLPMVARGFGLEGIVFMRGLAGQVPGMTSMSDIAADIPRQVPEGTRLFSWSCPDGSVAPTFLLRDGYANAAGLGRAPDDRGMELTFVERHAVDGLIKAAERQAQGVLADQAEPLLLLAGVDHQISQRGLPSALKAASAASRFDFRFADFDELSAAMRRHRGNVPEYRGEFHGSGAASVLGGTISARIHLKSRNAAAERLLVNQVEPAAALARLAGVVESGEAVLGVAWRWLLANHPHDDICGCSVDAVHRDDEYRFHQVESGGDGLRRRLTRRLVETFGGSADGDERFAFLAFSAQGRARRAAWRIELDFEARRTWGDYRLPESYAVVDERGREVPFREVERGLSTEHPHSTATLELHAELPPTTVARFFIEPRKQALARRASRRLENERLRVDVAADGSFTVLDKRTGRSHPRLGLFAEQADVGDTYDFADLIGERERVHARERVVISGAGGRGGLQSLRIERRLRLPLGLDGKRRSRKTVELPTSIVLSLAPGDGPLECAIDFTNTASDHRLRWNLPLSFAPSRTRAGLKFNEVERPIGRQPTARKAPRIHPEHPADHYVAAEVAADDGAHGLAVFSEFPINYEVVAGKPSRLTLALLRAVGFLTRLGMSTRDSGAGPTTPTPEAQCLGRAYRMRFAIRPFSAAEAGALFAEAALWRAEPLAEQMEGYWPQHAPAGFQGPFVTCDGGIVVSALKPRHEGAGVVLRLFNPSDTMVETVLRVRGANELRALGLDESPTVAWACQRLGDGWRISCPPWSLRSVEILGDGPWKP